MEWNDDPFQIPERGAGFLILLELSWLAAPFPQSLLSVLLYYLFKFAKPVSLYFCSLGATIHQWKRKCRWALPWLASAKCSPLNICPLGWGGEGRIHSPDSAKGTDSSYTHHSLSAFGAPRPALLFSSASQMGCEDPTEGTLVPPDQENVPSEFIPWQSPSCWVYRTEYNRLGPVLKQLIAHGIQSRKHEHM